MTHISYYVYSISNSTNTTEILSFRTFNKNDMCDDEKQIHRIAIPAKVTVYLPGKYTVLE